MLKAAEIVYGFTTSDIWTLFHSCAFDFAVWETWGALAFGGKLVVVPYYICRSPRDFYQLLIKEKITVLNQTPAAFYQLIDIAVNDPQSKQLSLKNIIFGGDVLDVHCLKPWVEKFGDKRPKIYNMYGITETTVHVTYHRITLDDLIYAEPVIGKVLPSYKVCLLDETGREVTAVGQKGEICVAGSSVTKGYLNNPKLTHEKFKVLKSESKNACDTKFIYKSGDLGAYSSDGNLLYSGRIDHQVKIRGYRIELAEIESLLNQQIEVKLAAVIMSGTEVEKNIW